MDTYPSPPPEKALKTLPILPEKTTTEELPTSISISNMY